MAKDISRQTVFALVALAIVVSLLGTFTVYNEVSNTRFVVSDQGSQVASGQVKLQVGSTTTMPQESNDSGEVKITILR